MFTRHLSLLLKLAFMVNEVSFCVCVCVCVCVCMTCGIVSLSCLWRREEPLCWVYRNKADSTRALKTRRLKR